MRRWLALALSALLLFTSGCQAVQGIDLNGMIKQSRQVISAEGSVTYEVEPPNGGISMATSGLSRRTM
ncbi:hypothetical protein Theco_0863 [Thermobacillus composti KWC4]|uniref:Uncharacterized protein n=2 Tax=Thermobacillus TaxID=76632 RepID=L0EBQ7_THECK|nr:hypothetical protein [Thermobacillus composti]AGA57059.1 hypothetical protein Theco_0863 [Thermobacillus composti KWC4]